MPMAMNERGGIVFSYSRLLMERACDSRLQCRKPGIALMMLNGQRSY
jgi:hypothetical protein